MLCLLLDVNDDRAQRWTPQTGAFPTPYGSPAFYYPPYLPTGPLRSPNVPVQFGSPQSHQSRLRSVLERSSYLSPGAMAPVMLPIPLPSTPDLHTLYRTSTVASDFENGPWHGYATHGRDGWLTGRSVHSSPRTMSERAPPVFDDPACGQLQSDRAEGGSEACSQGKPVVPACFSPRPSIVSIDVECATDSTTSLHTQVSSIPSMKMPDVSQPPSPAPQVAFPASGPLPLSNTTLESSPVVSSPQQPGTFDIEDPGSTTLRQGQPMSSTMPHSDSPHPPSDASTTSSRPSSRGQYAATETPTESVCEEEHHKDLSAELSQILSGPPREYVSHRLLRHPLVDQRQSIGQRPSRYQPEVRQSDFVPPHLSPFATHKDLYGKSTPAPLYPPSEYAPVVPPPPPASPVALETTTWSPPLGPVPPPVASPVPMPMPVPAAPLSTSSRVRPRSGAPTSTQTSPRHPPTHAFPGHALYPNPAVAAGFLLATPYQNPIPLPRQSTSGLNANARDPPPETYSIKAFRGTEHTTLVVYTYWDDAELLRELGRTYDRLRTWRKWVSTLR